MSEPSEPHRTAPITHQVGLLDRPRRVLAFGDSITQGAGGAREWFTEPAAGPGWLAELSRIFAGAGHSWVNRGVSGNRVPDLLARLDTDVLAVEPDLVVVYIGINDVWHWREGRGTTEPDYRNGLDELIGRLSQGGISIVLCTPTVIGEKSAGTNPQDEMLARYVEVSRQAAHRHALACCDLHAAFRTELARLNTDDADAGLLTTDGVHLTDAGNRLVAHTLAATLDPVRHPGAE